MTVKTEMTNTPQGEAAFRIQRAYLRMKRLRQTRQKLEVLLKERIKSSEGMSLVDKLNYSPKVSENIADLLKTIKRIEPYCKKSSIFPEIGVKFPDGSVYIGKMTSEAKKHGFGKIFYADGSIFEGSFTQDYKTGFGRDIFGDGSFYEGEYNKDLRNGYGKFHNVMGNTSIGYWKDDYQHGHGNENFPDGSSFIGEFKQGKKHGRGKFIWGNKQQYEGDFIEDVIEGYGIVQFPNGKIYKGFWMDNRMCGLGEMLWPDGRVFYGNFEDDNRNGFGVFIHEERAVKYTGFWKEGSFDGLGHIIKGEREYFGKWKEGDKIAEIEDPSIEMLLKKEVEGLKKHFQHI